MHTSGYHSSIYYYDCSFRALRALFAYQFFSKNHLRRKTIRAEQPVSLGVKLNHLSATAAVVVAVNTGPLFHQHPKILEAKKPLQRRQFRIALIDVKQAERRIAQTALKPVQLRFQYIPYSVTFTWMKTCCPLAGRITDIHVSVFPYAKTTIRACYDVNSHGGWLVIAERL